MNLIRVGMDYPVNALDDMYTATKKKLQDIVSSTYDDIDNVIPDDLLDIDFQQDSKDNEEQINQNRFNNFVNKMKDIFSIK